MSRSGRIEWLSHVLCVIGCHMLMSCSGSIESFVCHGHNDIVLVCHCCHMFMSCSMSWTCKEHL